MKQWWLHIVIVLLLAVVVAGPLVFRSGDEKQFTAGDDIQVTRLIVFTPHNEQILHEMSRGFNRYLESQGNQRVEFDWRTSGGTSDLRRMVIDQFQAAARGDKIDQGIGADLFFGGGEYEHNKLAWGIKVERDGETVQVALTIAPVIDDDYFAEAFPQPTIGGELLYHPDRLWVGVALSSFGIVYNRDVVAELSMPQPTTWDDLSAPQAFGWVALADPAHSGSIAATYTAILRRNGWTAGWATLRRSFANARYFAMSAGRVPVDVSAGEAAAGMCIDFYGRYQAGQIGSDRVAYIDPKFMTAITADPISILRGAPNHEMANKFVLWLLGKEAQGLWQRRIDADNGPLKYELRRLPIRRDMYQPGEMANWVDDVNPWAIAKPFPKAMPNMFPAVAIVSHAMAIDIHDDLKAAWRVVKDCDPQHANYQQILTLFDAMPDELILNWPDDELAGNWAAIIEDENHPRYNDVANVYRDFMGSLYARWSKPNQKLNDRLVWTAYFRNNYRQIVKLSTSE